MTCLCNCERLHSLTPTEKQNKRTMKTTDYFKGKYWVKVVDDRNNHIITLKVDTQPQDTIKNILPILDSCKINNISIDSLKNVTIEIHKY